MSKESKQQQAKFHEAIAGLYMNLCGVRSLCDSITIAKYSATLESIEEILDSLLEEVANDIATNAE
jgi:hypothetical protein